MSVTEQNLLEKLRALPPKRRAEVADFINFLSTTEARTRAAEQIGKVFDKLDALQLPPMSPEELQAEISAVRAERRARNADHR